MFLKRAGLARLVVVVVAAMIGIGVPGVARADIQNTPGFQHWWNMASGMCLDVTDGSTQPEAVVDQTYCRTSPSQEWQSMTVWVFEGHAWGPVILYLNNNSRLCLAVADLSGLNATPVVQRGCDVADPTQWWQQDYSNKPEEHWGIPLNITNVGVNGVLADGVGKCLDVENGWHVYGLPMQIWSCNPNTYNEAWGQV